jgi:hypothetical protein
MNGVALIAFDCRDGRILSTFLYGSAMGCNPIRVTLGLHFHSTNFATHGPLGRCHCSDVHYYNQTRMHLSLDKE